MPFKFLKIFLCALLLLGTTHALVAQAQSGGGEGYMAPVSPVQVIVQIVVAAIVLRVLGYFNLP